MFCRNLEVKDTAFARRKISDNAARTIGVNLQIRSAGFRMIGDCDLEFGSLTSENRVDPGEAQIQSDQVALALVHRNEAKAGQQKCQSERQSAICKRGANEVLWPGDLYPGFFGPSAPL